jgi:hypothetical protein
LEDCVEEANKSKLLQALALGTPLVANDLGATAAAGMHALDRAASRPTTEQLLRLKSLLKTKGVPTLVLRDSADAYYQSHPKWGLEELAKRLESGKLRGVTLSDTGERLSAGALRELIPKSSSGIVVLGDRVNNVGALAHEMGHATMAQKGLVKSLRRFSSRAGLLFGSPVMRSAALVGGLTPIVMDADSQYLMAPAAGIAAAQAPLLLEEATATTKGLGALKKLVGEGTVSRGAYQLAKRNLLRAFATYAAPAAGVVAMPALLAAIKKRYG